MSCTSEAARVFIDSVCRVCVQECQRVGVQDEIGNRQASLLLTLWRAYGREYAALGLLKLAGDSLNVAGVPPIFQIRCGLNVARCSIVPVVHSHTPCLVVGGMVKGDCQAEGSLRNPSLSFLLLLG